jgi:hypothetical protein
MLVLQSTIWREHICVISFYTATIFPILTWVWFLTHNKLHNWHNKGAAAHAPTSTSHYEGNIPHNTLTIIHKSQRPTANNGDLYDGSLGNMQFVVSLLSKFANKWVEMFWPSIKVLPGKGLKYTFWPPICLWAAQHCVAGQVGWHISDIHARVSSQKQVHINHTDSFLL